KFADARIYDLSALRQKRLAMDFVFDVNLQLAVCDEIKQKRGEVFGVHLAGVVWNGACKVERAYDGDAVVLHYFSSLGEFTIAAAFCGEVDDDRAGRHAGDHILGNEHW